MKANAVNIITLNNDIPFRLLLNLEAISLLHRPENIHSEHNFLPVLIFFMNDKFFSDTTLKTDSNKFSSPDFIKSLTVLELNTSGSMLLSS